MGVAVAAFADEVPASWGKPRESLLSLEAQLFKVARYPNVVMTLSPKDEIWIITVLDGYKGKSAKGVTLGSSAQEVLAHYGPPAQILEMTQRESWVYEAQGIAFQLREPPGYLLAVVLTLLEARCASPGPGSARAYSMAREEKVSGCRGVGPFVLMLPSPRP